MRKRLVVTGGSGFVAGSIIAQGAGTWDLHTFSRGAPIVNREDVTWHTFDLLETGRLARAMDEVQPSAVIHPAAMAGIDACQANPVQARRVNAEIAKELADLCSRHGARLIFVSTDNVFDGKSGGYAEDDPVSPINYYGRTKVEGERAVRESLPDSAVARLSLVMGLPVLGPGNSFLSRMIARLEQGQEVGVPPSEIRTPIDVITAGKALLELAGNTFAGTLHLAGNDTLGRHAMAQRIAERLHFDKELVVANDPTDIPGRAARPRDASLKNAKAARVLQTQMLGLDDGLDLILRKTQWPA